MVVVRYGRSEEIKEQRRRGVSQRTTSKSKTETHFILQTVEMLESRRHVRSARSRPFTRRKRASPASASKARTSLAAPNQRRPRIHSLPTSLFRTPPSSLPSPRAFWSTVFGVLYISRSLYTTDEPFRAVFGAVSIGELSLLFTLPAHTTGQGFVRFCAFSVGKHRIFVGVWGFS